jgi:hypothetical protein
MIVQANFHAEQQIQPQQQQQLPEINLPNTLDELGAIVMQTIANGERIDMNLLKASLRNVIAITPGQPKYLVRRLQNNAAMVVPMCEKDLYKLLKQYGLVSYIEVKTMTIDKLVRKAEFSETLTVFVKGADGMYYAYDRRQ